MENMVQEHLEAIECLHISPDMNIIEHVWDYINHQIRFMDSPSTTVDQLHNALQRARNGMPQGEIMHPVLYMHTPKKSGTMQKSAMLQLL